MYLHLSICFAICLWVAEIVLKLSRIDSRLLAKSLILFSIVSNFLSTIKSLLGATYTAVSFLSKISTKASPNFVERTPTGKARS